MNDRKKTKAQLIAELEELRKLKAEFEAEGSTFKSSALDKNFQALMESTDDYILISDKNGLPVMFNSSYRKIMKEALGIDMKPGLQPHKLLPDKKVVKWWDNIHSRVLSGEKFRIEYSHYFGKDVTLHFEFSYNPIFDGDDVNGFIEISRDITERKKVEETLLESEEKYRSLIENAPNFILTLDLEGKILFINHIVPGLNKEEVIGRSFYDFIEPEYQSRVRETIKEVIKTGKPNKYQIMGTGPNGKKSWYDTQIGVMNKNERIVGLTLITTDVTERKQAEEALKESEERFKLAVQATSDGIWDWNILTNEEYYSPQWCKILGYSYDDPELPHVYDSWASRIHPDDYERVMNVVKAHFEGGKIYNVDYRHRHKSGEYRWQNSCGQTIFDENGKPIRMTGCIRDITERKKTEETRIKTNKYLQSIIDCSLDMIVVVDKDRHIVEFNKAACETFGYSKEEIVGKHVHILYFSVEEGLYISSQIMKNGIFTGEIQNVRKNGEVFTSFLSSALMRDENGEVVGTVGNSRDITVQKQSGAELKSSREQLRALTEYLHQVREKERTLIAREIHDELGQALTALKMDVSWIERNLPKKIESLPEKIKSMSELIDKTLKTTKEMIYELRPTILDDFGLEAALEWHAGEFQNRTEITCEIHTDIEKLILDQYRSTTIYRIFQESLTNAARHSNATRVNVNVKEDNGNLVLRIEDNGKGITKEQINDSKSFGLIGMSERLFLLKGNLEVYGVKDKGTTIIATIPLERRSESR